MIDVSDKMLYNEAKAEKEFLSLINATVSHELRNPLNSLITQMTLMSAIMLKFNTIMPMLIEGRTISAQL